MEGLFESVVTYWKYNFWFSTTCTVAGLILISPFLLSKKLRKRASSMDVDPEFIGMAAILLAVIGFAIYNNL